VETIREWMAKYLGGDKAAIVGPAAASGSPEASYLLSSIRLANRLIFDAAQGRQDYAGMGTTVVAVLARGDTLMLAHVGDSRIYRIRDGRIAQVSRDHSFVQEQVDRGIITAEAAMASQYRHMITRALGLRETVEVDLIEEPAVAGDVILLCSDGLSDLLEDEEIQTSVQEHAADLEQACQALVDRANYKGGDDNVTTLLIRAQTGNPGRRPATGGAGGAVGGGGALGWLKRVFRG
jgi:PPM family protein phosphatase